MAELLSLGQVHDSATPSSAAAKIYIKNETGYGSNAGTGNFSANMWYETQDIAPMGPVGLLEARKLYVLVEHGGNAVVNIRPITDISNVLPKQAFTLTAPTSGSRKIEMLIVPFSESCTWARMRIERVSCDGYLWIIGAWIAYKPLTDIYEKAMQF